MTDLEKEIQRHLRIARKKMVGENEFLQKLHLISCEEYISFAIERYHAANQFEKLLEAAIKSAKDAQLIQLSAALQRNLDDEEGRTDTGEIDPELAHSTWRRDFYLALGIAEEDLHTVSTSLPTKKYQLAINNIIQSESLWQMVGAILALEATIPAEFQRMQKARDLLLPKRFTIDVNDPEVDKEMKAKNSKYLDDHILHDANAHYPDLLYAVVQELSAEKLVDLIDGIIKITEAKINFYSNLSLAKSIQ